jgi:predicted outer membrane repeat protein
MDDNTIFVSPGTYFENIDFLGKAITVKGTAGHELTVIDGYQAGSVVVFDNGEGPDSVLEGFQIVNGNAAKGGGIYCEGASPTLRNNDIWGNSTTYLGEGGGIYCQYHSATIECNSVHDNHAYKGGGLCCIHASPTIVNNFIFHNEAQYPGLGGGIYCAESSSKPDISNNTICQNSAYHFGGGIASVSKASPVVTNSILWDNDAGFGSEIYLGATVNISYSDLLGGQASVFEATGGVLNWGDGMIDGDPLFLDPFNDDYHLTYASPCIDAGDNNAPSLPVTDFEGDPRVFPGNGKGYRAGSPPQPTIVDMGADEHCLLRREQYISK